LAGLFTSTRPSRAWGLLYSMRPGIVTPYAQSYCDGLFKMMYLLSHVGLPPALVTNRCSSRPAADMDTLIVLRQSEELPAEAVKALTDFVTRGGRVTPTRPPPCAGISWNDPLCGPAIP